MREKSAMAGEAMNGMRSGDVAQSLSQDVVVRWKRGLGVGLTGRAPRTLSGRNGLAQFSDWAIATAADPSGFEALSYQRTLSMLRVYAQLATPYRLTRGVEAGRGTSGEVVVVVNGLRACTHVRVGDQIGALRPGQMAVNPADTPFTLWTTSVTDPTILLVREETLGVVDAVLPGDSASLLPRTVAAFVQRFVADAATANRPVDAEAERIVIELLRATVTQHSGQVGRHLSSSAAVVRQRAREMIEERYADPDFSPDSIAQDLFMSRRQLYRHFDDTGTTPSRLINERRLRCARELLSGDHPMLLEEVAHRSGYASVSTLRNRFKSEFGIAPRQFSESVIARAEVHGVWENRVDPPGIPIHDTDFELGDNVRKHDLRRLAESSRHEEG
ncbi:helix-turn-helix domain-containing protein [Gordonia sp. 852002-51296_SCH5728562-b]|uniref:helix-turn-helix domain-containing protein n=1 Tax=Gordonia sp. 852002-51296_SCH5728562-b TaxID=1834101 RepID=UPI0009ED5E11|nr:AraC family transcriptional regulator [Gordonia sp. 852002-51296_SCH5728562-b]